MVEFFIGVDPGVSGGIAIINGDAILALPITSSERDLWELLQPYGTPILRHPSEMPLTYAVLEKVGGFVATDRDRPGMGASMFTFGKNYGLCYMALIAASIPFDTISPRKWQSAYGVARMKGESKSKWKGRLKNIAQRLFPSVKVTLAIADALLLVEYARRTYLGSSRTS